MIFTNNEEGATMNSLVMSNVLQRLGYCAAVCLAWAAFVLLPVAPLAAQGESDMPAIAIDGDEFRHAEGAFEGWDGDTIIRVAGQAYQIDFDIDELMTTQGRPVRLGNLRPGTQVLLDLDFGVRSAGGLDVATAMTVLEP